MPPWQKSRHWSHFRSDEIGTGLQIPVLTRFPCANRYLAAAARLVFERARERADRLAVELLQAAAETAAANAWAARLEDEVADLRTGRQAGGATAGQAARRLGHLAAAIVGADRAARR
jgi:hypothetical protein